MIDFDAIEAGNEPLNAFTDIDREAAFGEGPLSGLTVGVKGNIAVQNMPWHAGLEAFESRLAERDADAVALLRQAGAAIIGVLNMEEGALGAKTDNPHFGPAQNPHRIGFSPGGSSGGSGAAVAAARRYGAVLASHDDTTAGQVAVSAHHGVRLAEFPTTVAAARANHGHRIANIMGGPNLVRGGSHSGNVAAIDLAEAGLLDIISSDYVPASLLLAAVQLGQHWGDMARGLHTVTAAPARYTGLEDRGRLDIGKSADLIRFRLTEGVPALRAVWSKGARVA